MIGQSNNAFSILGFSLAENEESMFCSFHPFADKTNNKHLWKPFSRSYEDHSIKTFQRLLVILKIGIELYLNYVFRYSFNNIAPMVFLVNVLFLVSSNMRLI